ncbi:26955_t:CDS:2, partial [Dentiscutata erythropus]
MPIVEKDLNSSSQVNIIKTNENIDNENDLSLSELDESYSEKNGFELLNIKTKSDDFNDEIFLINEMDNDFNF